MKYIPYIIIILICYISSCTQSKHEKRQDNEFSLFIALYDNAKFKLFVNDTLSYNGKFKLNHISIIEEDILFHDMYIGNFIKSQNTKINFVSKTVDTCLYYNTQNVDSILICNFLDEKGLMILSN